jgi:hypothetical protein
MHQNLPDGSSESYGRAEPSQPDSTHRLWAERDTAAHEYQVDENNSPGHSCGQRDLRKELRGTEVLEGIMAGVVIASAVSVFLGGLVMGVIAVIAIAVRREDRRCTLPIDAPDRLSRNTRLLIGIRRRDLDQEFLRPMGQPVH